MTVAVTSEASTWAMLMLSFVGLYLAAFSVGMKVGQIAEAALRAQDERTNQQWAAIQS
jgi:hypothetical protein